MARSGACRGACHGMPRGLPWYFRGLPSRAVGLAMAFRGALSWHNMRVSKATDMVLQWTAMASSRSVYIYVVGIDHSYSTNAAYYHVLMFCFRIAGSSAYATHTVVRTQV